MINSIIYDINERMNIKLNKIKYISPVLINKIYKCKSMTKNLNKSEYKQFSAIDYYYSNIEESKEMIKNENKIHDNSIEEIINEMTKYELPDLLQPIPISIAKHYERHNPDNEIINEIVNSLKELIPIKYV